MAALFIRRPGAICNTVTSRANQATSFCTLIVAFALEGGSLKRSLGMAVVMLAIPKASGFEDATRGVLRKANR